ncbi:MAG: flippase-like domain-containing protein [Candidatus Bathyarchaeota archaeon]|nr:MAG: flippase-like domain-containing protein [Candidatus Bathyarchaeota archaeon]
MKKLSGKIRTIMIPVQIAVSILILYLLFQNVNLTETYHILSQVNIPILLLSTVFFLLASFAIGFGLHAALKSVNSAPSMKTTQLANFGGQLLSDITPAKSGYFATPVLLNQLEEVPYEKGLMSVMSVGAINFFIKAIFATTALVYFINRIPIDPTMTNAMLIGIAILLAAGIGLTVLVWTNCFSELLLKLAKIPVIGKLIKKLCEIRTMFTKDKTGIQKSAVTIILTVVASIIFSGISLYILAQAMGMTQPTFQDFFLMGPLTAVFMYVPVTFAGLGLQEAAYVFLLTNIGAPIEIALPFALLIRILAVTTDLIGLPPLLKTSTGIFKKLDKN